MADTALSDDVTWLPSWTDSVMETTDMADSLSDFITELTTTAAPKLDKEPIRYGYFVSVGIIIPLGLIFNTLSIVVFATSKSLRKSTTGLYLVSLAIADDLFLIGELLRWLDTSKYISTYNYQAVSDEVCQFVFSLRYGAKLTSAWITVAITAERFFIVTFPLKAARVCTRKMAIIVIGVTFGVCFFLGLYPLFTIGIAMYNNEAACLITNEKWYLIGSWVVLRVGSLLLPGILVIILTVIIIIYLMRARLKRIRNLSEGRSSVTTIAKALPGVAMEKQLTMMLLAVAIAFIILRLPYTILYYINHYKKLIWVPLNMTFSHHIYVAHKAADIFATTNYAVNFFLYCLSGSSFRKQFRILFGCEKADLPRKMYSMSTASHHAVNVHLKVNGQPYSKGKTTLIRHDNGNHTMTSTYSVTPSVTPAVTPAVTPGVTPGVTPAITPAVTPSMTPVVTPAVTPSMTPVVTPGVTPVVTPCGGSPETERNDHSTICPSQPPGASNKLWDDTVYTHSAYENICLDQETRL